MKLDNFKYIIRTSLLTTLLAMELTSPFIQTEAIVKPEVTDVTFDSTPTFQDIIYGTVAEQESLWYHDLLKVDTARSQFGLTGEGVTIAVIDSGIAPINGLEEKIVDSYDFAENTETLNGKPILKTSHGTSVASVLTGIAPNVKLIDFNVTFDEKGGLSTDGIIQSYQQILNLLDIGVDIDIVQMSFGDDNYSRTEHHLLKQIASRGVLLVTSSGNTGTDQIRYPSAYDDVISVGSIDSTKYRSEFSSFGKFVDVVAPGSEIEVLSRFGITQRATGTSFAAPLVSGILALYKEAYPTASPSKLTQMLFENTEDLGSKGKDNEYGYGLVSAIPPKQYALQNTLVSQVFNSLN